MCAGPGWAAEVNNLAGLQTALASASTEEIVATQTIAITANVTLNGNGRTLRLKDGATGSVIKIGDADSSPTVAINDLVIANGKATDGNGGGIWAYAADKITITNCVFKKNTASGSGGAWGGGVHFGGSVKDIKVAQCTFIGNEASTSDTFNTYGGGMYLNLGDGCTASIVNCTFTGNKAINTSENPSGNPAYGGGLYTNYGNNKPTVKYCTFVGNEATEGAEIYDYRAHTVTNSIVYGDVPNDLALTNCLTKSDLASAPTSEEVRDKDGKVTHTVFRKYAQLSAAVDKGATTDAPAEDQLGNTRNGKPDIGAVEIEKVPVTLQGLDIRFLLDPITMTVEQNGVTKRPPWKEDFAYQRIYSDGSRENVITVPLYSQEGTWPDWLTIDSNYIIARPTWEVKPGDYTVKLRGTAYYNGFTATDTTNLTVTVTGYTELSLSIADAVLTVYPGGPESQLDINDMRIVKGKHSLRGWESVPVSGVSNSKAVGLPSWLTWEDGTDLIKAKAPAGTTPGRYEYEYNVTVSRNGLKGTGKGKLIVVVSEKSEPEPAKLAMNSVILPGALVGSPYSAKLYATGDEPMQWEMWPPLPGLTINESTGEISGTPTATGTRSFFVYVENPANAGKPDGKEFFLIVRDEPPSSWKHARSVTKVAKGETFDLTFWTTKGKKVEYSSEKKPSSTYLQKVTTHTSDEAGGGYIRYTCVWPKKVKHTYTFKIKAKNSYGFSTYYREQRVSVGGVVGASVGGEPGDGLILADDGEEQDEEINEEYPDDYTPEDGADYSDGVTYFHNGGIDEDGNITAVVGTGGNVDPSVTDSEYLYDTVDALLSALAGRLDKVVSLEFRKGAAVDVSKLASLPNLTDLSIDECDVAYLDLSGNTTLKRLSLYGCGNLTSLNVSGCSSLASLSVTECAALAELDVTNCPALEGVTVTNAAISSLNLSNRANLASVNVTGCANLETLNVSGCPALANLEAGYSGLVSLNAEGDSALTDVYLNSSDIAALDLSGCSGLRALSLAGVPNLRELTLPTEGAEITELTLTGSSVPSLNLSGWANLVSLDLNGSRNMTVLDVSDCSSLRTLNLSQCGMLDTLKLSGCSALEKLTANGCVSLTSLALAEEGALRELNVNGSVFLASLDVSGQSLGHLDLDGLNMLTEVDCSAQAISGVTMSQTMNLVDYAGNGLCRVSDVRGSGMAGSAGVMNVAGLASDGAGMAPGWDPETGIATFSSVPASVSYVYDTGLDGVTMNVTLTLDGEANDNPTSNRDSGGGCSLGLEALALACALPLLIRKGRR